MAAVTDCSVRDFLSRSPPLRSPTAPCFFPISAEPKTSATASPTVMPFLTRSATGGGYMKPEPVPTVTRPSLSMTAQYWKS